MEVIAVVVAIVVAKIVDVLEPSVIEIAETGRLQAA